MNYMNIGLIIFIFYHHVDCYQIIWDNNATVDFNSLEYSRSGDVRLPNWMLIYPGTKWCGAGNIADNDTNYGKFRDTDKCCRNHDMCPDIIEGYQTKYGLTNPNFYTRLNCYCDTQFYQCLKTVDGHVSTQVGHLYFTFLATQCFKEEYPILSCEKYSYIPTKKCQKYELDDATQKQYQWFDVPNY